MFSRVQLTVYLATLSYTEKSLAFNLFRDLFWKHNGNVVVERGETGLNDEVVGLQGRDNVFASTYKDGVYFIPSSGALSTPSSLPTPTQPTLLTVITPSPGAPGVPITEQSQIVTSYVAYYTLCPLSTSGAIRYTNASRTTATLTSAPTASWDASECLTSYSPTVTPICHTLLYGIATAVTVTNCSQAVTFSTDFRMTWNPTASNGVGMQTNYYVAPWQALAAPGVVPDWVEVRECSANSGDNSTILDTTEVEVCVDHYEEWNIQTLTVTTSSVFHVTIASTIHGPSALLISTLRTDITALQSWIDVTTQVAFYMPFETVTTLRNRSATALDTLVPSLVDGVPAPSSLELDSTTTATTTKTNTRTVTKNPSGLESLLPIEPTDVGELTSASALPAIDSELVLASIASVLSFPPMPSVPSVLSFPPVRSVASPVPVEGPPLLLILGSAGLTLEPSTPQLANSAVETEVSAQTTLPDPVASAMESEVLEETPIPAAIASSVESGIRLVPSIVWALASTLATELPLEPSATGVFPEASISVAEAAPSLVKAIPSIPEGLTSVKVSFASRPEVSGIGPASPQLIFSTLLDLNNTIGQ